MRIYRLIQQIPEIKGKHRASRLLLRKTILKSENIIISCRNGLRFYCPNFKEYICFELLINGIYEKKNIDNILKNLPQNGVLFDIGANIGAIALPIAKARPDVQIFCFEASSVVFSALEKNIELNKLHNVKAINCLLTDELVGLLPFFSPKEQFGKGSMSPVFTDEYEMIQTETLDNFICQNNLNRLDFIKIDIEGFEKTVFDGARDMFKKFKPKVLFEFLDWAENASGKHGAGDAQRFLFEMDYRIFNLSNRLTELHDPLIIGGADLLAKP